MSASPGGIAPLNWPALVAEALRRRKAEKLTQKEHAALAGVSIPTMIAFDRAEQTLSLGKAIAILRVVGLVEEPSAEGTQDALVRDAVARWHGLIRDLPKESPARFLHGGYRIDYALEGDLKASDPHKLIGLLRQAVAPHTGWPMFWPPQRDELAPREVDGVVECWLAPGDKSGFDSPLFDAAHCDFWRAAPEGRLVLIRGYQEDAQETFPPGTIFDATLPIWRLGEAFLHAAQLARLMTRMTDGVTIHLRAHYSGLQGRDLKAWMSPLSVDYFGGCHSGSRRARTDAVVLDARTTVAAVETDLAGLVTPLAESLLERFGVSRLSPEIVAAELTRMRANRFNVSG